MATRQFQRSIADSAKPEIERAIGDLGLQRFKVGRQEIAHANGSIIRFHGLERQITQIKGWAGIGLVWVEEAQFVPEAAWIELLPTIRVPGSQIWATWNPRYDADWIYARCVLQPEEGERHVEINYVDNPAWPSPPGRFDPEAAGLEPLHELEEERLRDLRLDPEKHSHVWEGQLRSDASMMFAAGDFRLLDSAPEWTKFRRVRAWDFAYGGEDYTAGVLAASVEPEGTTDRDALVLDVVRRRVGPEALAQLVVDTALRDGEGVEICLPEDPAAGAVALLAVSEALREGLPWVPRIHVEAPLKSKEQRAFAYSRFVATGHVWVLQRPWTRGFVAEHAAFATERAEHDDMVDAAGDAVRVLGVAEEQVWAW